jgi:hypothetical protein
MMNRRQFVLFMAAAAGTAACDRLQPITQQPSPVGPAASPIPSPAVTTLGFNPVQGPMPLSTSGVVTAQQVTHLTSAQQVTSLASYEVKDDLVLPDGFTYDVLASWGDKVGDSRFGFNNDYLALIETGKNEGYLAVNFEYISSGPWLQGFEKVVGKRLPTEDVIKAVEKAVKANKDPNAPPGLNAFLLSEKDPVKQKIKAIAREGLIDQGAGVISVRRGADGRWQRTNSKADRRITGISGLEDKRYLKSTGPATAIFRKVKGQGYVDKLGDKIIGTFQNCAGGTTPWGTVLSAEENFQVQVPEPVYADGTSFPPATSPFNQADGELSGLGNVFGLAGNKYGWMVEFDPANPNDYGTKHTWLGRYRHEAFGIRAVAGKPLAAYSGCDRRGGHLYKFVSKGKITNPKDKANSKLFADGMLYAAQFNADGTGRWIPLTPKTPVNPTLPTFLAGVMLTLPDRPKGGSMQVSEDEAIEAYKKRFKTLGDLYSGTPLEKQGAILIDAHYAANAAGATCTARPEDTEIAPDGSLYVAFTSGGISKSDGSPDIRIFRGPDGNTAYEYGWIMRLVETGNDPAAMSFKWEIMATGGEPAAGGAGFANPDNLAFDGKGNLWIVTDMSTDTLNQAVPANRIAPNGVLLSQSKLRGLFGNNTVWCMPLDGDSAGQAFLFAIGPVECEITGPVFTTDNKTLFLAIQHPGEFNGLRKDMAMETREFALRTTTGDEFMQTRQVPLGSNWPTKKANDPPKPSVVVVRRTNDGTITA